MMLIVSLLSLFLLTCSCSHRLLCLVDRIDAETDDYPHSPGQTYRRVKARRVFVRFISQQADMQV